MALGRNFRPPTELRSVWFIKLDVDDATKNVKIVLIQYDRQTCWILKNDKWQFDIIAKSCTISITCTGSVISVKFFILLYLMVNFSGSVAEI